MKIISWNIARRAEAWRILVQTDADVALLQEAAAPPQDIAGRVEPGMSDWETAGADCRRPWRAAVVRLTDQVAVRWIETAALVDAKPHQVGVSRQGTLAAAEVSVHGTTVLVVSLYGLWEKPHASAGSSFIYADASVHRLISDLSSLVGNSGARSIIAAGDLNILLGYGEYGNRYWASRYATVFDRLGALGLNFVGPQAPCGRQAEPWPNELPQTSRNVPTYTTTRQSPLTATRQLDFVFASPDLADHITVTALNLPEHWGPSDHCRVEIELRPEIAKSVQTFRKVQRPDPDPN